MWHRAGGQRHVSGAVTHWRHATCSNCCGHGTQQYGYDTFFAAVDCRRRRRYPGTICNDIRAAARKGVADLDNECCAARCQLMGPSAQAAIQWACCARWDGDLWGSRPVMWMRSKTIHTFFGANSPRLFPSPLPPPLPPCQAKLEELEAEMLEVNGNSERLMRSYSELVELQLVLEKAGSFFDQARVDAQVRRGSLERANGIFCREGAWHGRPWGIGKRNMPKGSSGHE